MKTNPISAKSAAHNQNRDGKSTILAIAAFEAKYKMSSEEFRIRYDKGSVGDDMDFIEWAATLDMLEKIQRHLAMIHKG